MKKCRQDLILYSNLCSNSLLTPSFYSFYPFYRVNYSSNNTEFSQYFVKVRGPVSLAIYVSSRTRRVVTSPVHDSRNRINKRISRHATVYELFQLSDVIPTANVIALETFDPIEHSRNPFELLVLFACADGIGLLTKVDVRIPGNTTFFCGTSSKVVV